MQLSEDSLLTWKENDDHRRLTFKRALPCFECPHLKICHLRSRSAESVNVNKMGQVR